MGVNHARAIAMSSDTTLSIVVDSDLERASQVAKQYGESFSSNPQDALGADAVILASPTPTHAALGLNILDHGKPLLIEKPLTTTAADTQRLIELAARNGTALMGGFVERFNPVLNTALGLLSSEPVLHVATRRHSPPSSRSSSSVVWDLLIHDIDLVLRLFPGQAPTCAKAVSISPEGASFKEVADALLLFSSGMASLSSSRLGQRKVRDVTIATASRLFELDLLRQTLSVYRNINHAQIVEGSTTYRADTVIDIPFVRHGGEPLELQLAHFVRIIRGEVDQTQERESLFAPHRMAVQIEDES